jgi:hypothetical protein
MTVVLAVLIAALIAASVLAPSPRRSRLAWVAACAVVGVCGPSLVLAIEADRGVLTMSIAAAVALLAMATWLARGVDPGPGSDQSGPAGERPPEPSPPWDWMDFDRARADWSRPRTPA